MLRVLMLRKGYTSERLSEECGVPKSTIDKIASGSTDNPRYKSLTSIMAALGMGVDDLVSLMDDVGVRGGDSERDLLTMYHRLNAEGRGRARQLISDMLDSGHYDVEKPVATGAGNYCSNAAAAMEGNVEKVERNPEEVERIVRAGREFLDAAENPPL